MDSNPLTALTPELVDQKLQALAQASTEKVAQLNIQRTAALKQELEAAQNYVPYADPITTAGDMGIKLAQGVVDLGQSVVGAGSLVTGGLVGKGMRAIGYDPEATNQFLGGFLSPAQQAADAKVAAAKGFKDTILASLQNPRSIAGSVAESLPGSIAGMGVSGAVAEGIAAKAAQQAIKSGLGAEAASLAAKDAIDAASTRLLASGALAEGAQTAGQIADQAQGAGRNYSDYALPSLAAGAITGGISLATGKLMGSAQTDIAAGTHTLKGNFATKLGKEALSEGVLEELPQSAQEQYFTNIAMGEQDRMKGVAEAGAQGMLSGAAMGVGFGMLHREHGPKAQTSIDESKVPANQAENFAKAAAENNPEVFTNPDSESYSPTLGIAAMLKHSISGEATRDSLMQNLQRTTDMVGQLEDQQDALREQLKSASPADSKAIVQQMAALDKQIQGGYDALSQTAVEFQKSATPEVVKQTVEQADQSPSEDSQAAADAVLNLAMASSDKIDPEVATNLASNKDNALSDEQRSFLESYSAARAEEDKLKTMGKVSQEVLYGEQKQGGNIGIVQYRDRIGAALQAGNTEMAQSLLSMLGNFAASQQSKAQAAAAATAAHGLGGKIIRTDDGTSARWAVAPDQSIKKGALAKQGGMEVTSGRLVVAMRAEARAIAATHAEMTKAVALAQNKDAAVQSVSSQQPASNAPVDTTLANATPNGSPASLFREKREREGRVEGGGREGETVNSTQTVASTQQTSVSDPSSLASPAAGQVSAPVVDQATASPDSTTSSLTRSPDASPASSVAGAPSSQAAPTALAETSPRTTLADADAKHARQEEAVRQAAQNIAARKAEKEAAAAAEQQASAPAESAAAEAAPQQGQEHAGHEHLALFEQKTKDGEAREYQDRNLVADYFKQSAGQGESIRPLASVKDFLSKLATGVVQAADFLKDGTVTDQGNTAVDTFIQAAKHWDSNITANFTRASDPKFFYKDMVQFLLNEHGVAEENIRTAIAYAAFSWLGENAMRPAYNDSAEINAILGRDEDHIVSQQEITALGKIGTRESVVQNAMGARVVQALGLKSTKAAPANLQAQLESQLGAHVAKLLQDQGVIERKSLTGAEMKVLTGNAETKATAQFKFLAMARDEQGQLSAQATSIVNDVKGSQGMVDKLFAVEPGLKAPTMEPVKFGQKTTRNTEQKIPETLRKIVEADNKQASYVRQDMAQLLSNMSDSLMLAVAGGVEEDANKVHKSNRLPNQAKNDALRREISNLRDFIANTIMPSEQGFEQPVFFDHSVWKQQRVGIATNMINPQSSKVHRAFLFRSNWPTEVQLHDADSLTNFKLRVAEGLGVKTDKVDQQTALTQYEALAGKDVIKSAVAAISSGLTEGGTFTAAQEEAIKAGVKAGGEDMHSFDALVALATMQQAKAEGKTSFTSHLAAEVDGVTNGPMLTHLLLGAAQTANQLFDLLNRGGFYQLGSQQTQYNVWHSMGNHDLYENTAYNMSQAIQQANIPERVLKSLYAFTGELADSNGTVQKAGRNIIKTPLTAMVFGSSVDNAIRSMADKFVESIYGAIEDTAAGKQGAMSIDELKAHLRTLGVPVSDRSTIKDLMDNEMSADSLKKVQGTFINTIGESVKTTMKTDFADFIEQRRQFNQTAQLSFALYDAAYRGIREQYIERLVKEGKVATRTTQHGQQEILHDLTAEQEADLAKQVQDLLPVMHTPLSKASGELDAGLFASKDARKLGQDAFYTGKVNFGQPFADNGAKSVTTHAYTKEQSAPGVAMMVMSTHSADSAISHTSDEQAHSLNIHDARVTGIGQLHNVARNMNQATWNTMLNYSSPAEVSAMLQRVVAGLSGLVENGGLPAKSQQYLAEAVAKMAAKAEEEPASFVQRIANEARAMAHSADQVKLGALAQMATIDQYALEGGNYTITNEDRAAAQAMLDKLQAGLTDQEQAALDNVNGLLKKALKGEYTVQASPDPEMDPKASPFGVQGSPRIAPEQRLVSFFKDNPKTSAKDVLAFLKGQSLTEFQSRLVAMLTRSLGAKAGTTSVLYVTPQTKEGEALSIQQDARGWYSQQDGQRQVHLLSPDFVNSGLTTELVLHELTHAAVGQQIEAPTKETKPFVQELETLRQMVIATGIKGFADATKDVHELVAWGMNNPAFQKVLAQVDMVSKNGSLVSGFMDFINKIVGLITGRQHEATSNGLAALVLNTTGLMAAATRANGSNNSEATIMQKMAATVNNYTTQDIYNALAQASNTQLDPAFETHLQDLLGGIVEQLHGPYGSFTDALMTNTPLSPQDVFLQAQLQGKANFAMEALAVGFRISDQEAFVMEQIEATVKAALSSKDGSTTAAYRELSKLYIEAAKTVKPADFISATTSAQEAQDLHDFLFKMEGGADKKSDYLSRFAAMGLGHQQTSELLGFNTQVLGAAEQALASANLSIAEKLHTAFEKIMSWINGKLTSTFAGQKADEKLETLVKQLVNIESRRRSQIADQRSVVMDTLEGMARDGATKLREKVDKFANSSFFKNSTNGYVKALGAMTSAVAQDRVNVMLDGLNKLRDKHIGGQQGFFISMFNEVRGSTEEIQVLHELLRAAKKNEGDRKDIMDAWTRAAKESFQGGGEYMTKEMNAAVSAYLRTDPSALLASYGNDMAAMARLVQDNAHLKLEIANTEQALANVAPQHATLYGNLARTLAAYRSNGKVGKHLLMNAGNIAQLYGTAHVGTLAQSQIDAATPVIDKLVSLQALAYLPGSHKVNLGHVFDTEGARTDGGHGIATVLGLHAGLAKQSSERLFDSAAALQMKGYLPEKLNNYTDIVFANAEEGEHLAQVGYSVGRELKKDQSDPDRATRKLYVMRGVPTRRWVSGTLSTTGMHTKGSRTLGMNFNTASAANQYSANDIMQMARNRQSMVASLDNVVYDPMKDDNAYMAPVLNANGEVVNFRYMMDEHTKDTLLERDNRFEHLLGSMAGNVFDKETSAAHNKTAVQILHDQFKDQFAERKESFLTVGVNSTDPQLREIWNMLPNSTKMEVRRIWGNDNMRVRSDVLNMQFGYRKLSIAQVFEKDPEAKRNIVEKMAVDLAEHILSPIYDEAGRAVGRHRAAIMVARGEEVWQTIVAKAKETFVIRNLKTLMNNMGSNISELWWFGVPVKDIITHHRVAMKGALTYRKDSAELAQLKIQKETGSLQGQALKDAERRMTVLEDSIARNPIYPLIEAGLMPTIVEDVAADDDIYSFNSRFNQKIDNVVKELNPHVVNTAKFLMMARDTPLFQAMHYGTQLSDFVARYTLYQHLTTKAEPVEQKKALQMASDAFVNYDIPTHPLMQYANDSGLIMFSKYYVRMQKVIAMLYRENPGRAMALLVGKHYFRQAPFLTDASFVHHLGNPFNAGAFEYVHALDEMATVNALMSPFR